jgi:hypothetical protein
MILGVFPFIAIQPSHRNQMFRSHGAIYPQPLIAERHHAFCPESQDEYPERDVQGTHFSPVTPIPVPGK